jgi:hypothetical protein
MDYRRQPTIGGSGGVRKVGGKNAQPVCIPVNTVEGQRLLKLAEQYQRTQASKSSLKK